MQLRDGISVDRPLGVGLRVSVALLLAGLLYLFLPAEQIDLAVYTRGGQAAISGTDSVYVDSETWPLPFTYPPFAAVLFAPLGFVPPILLRILFAITSTAALLRILCLTHRALEEECAARRELTPLFVTLLLLSVLVAEPILVNQRLGQINLYLGWMIAEDLLARRRRRLPGVLVGLAAAIKLTPAVFGLYLFVRRDWKGLIGAIIGGASATLVGALVLPHSTWDFLSRAVRDPSRVGGVAYSSNQSLNGVIWRAIGPGGSSVLWLGCVVVVLLAGVWLMLRLVRSELFVGALLVNAMLGLLISPISWSHHWFWLLPWAMMLWAYGGRSGERWHWGARMALLVMVPAWTWMIRWMPSADDREYGVHWVGKILTDAYPITVIVSATWLALWAVNRSARSPHDIAL